MKSNFTFLEEEIDTQPIYKMAKTAEELYIEGHFDSELTETRKAVEKIVALIVDQEFIDVPQYSSLSNTLRILKNSNRVSDNAIDIFYKLKRIGNEATHVAIQVSKATALDALVNLHMVAVAFVSKYYDRNIVTEFFEPKSVDYNTHERKLIYVQTADNDSGNWMAYAGLEKIGDATIDGFEIDGRPNSNDLRKIADNRVSQYMRTAGVPHNLQWAELAYRKKDHTWFRDYEVHDVLQRSGIEKTDITEGNEWYKTDLETAKSAIKAVKEGRHSLNLVSNPVNNKIKIVLRPEQEAAVKQAKNAFKKYDKVLWNAKMRFGKTLSALNLVKESNYQRVLIMTHRPVVSDSWFDDFNKIQMPERGYQFGSRHKGEKLEDLYLSKNPFVYFASLQDLRGSKVFGGTVSDKNELIAKINWDLIIIDEAHEGTQTELAQQVINTIDKENTKILELSGTPFNILSQYNDDQVYTWDYVMEQEAKLNWDVDHPDQVNPYQGLPKVSMYTFDMQKNFSNINFIDPTNKSFNFKEYFRVNDTGKFVYERQVNQFLDNITTKDSRTNYPFSTTKFRDELRHTLWLLPGVKEAKALQELMEKHPVFGKEYTIVNVVSNGDDIDASESDLQRVRDAITDDSTKTKTITLTVRKLTTGVTVKEWTGVIFLSNTNSSMQYLQAAFRAQTPFSTEKTGYKTNCYIFDFAPDRALTIMADSVQLSTGVGKKTSAVQKEKMRQLLNFLPIIGEKGNQMKEYNVDNLLTKLKRVYAEKAVKSGFDDDSLYSDELLTLDNADLTDFNDLKAIVGITKSEKKPIKININDQGLNDAEYDDAIQGQKKTKKERTPEEQAAIDKYNEIKKQRKSMISILRAISIRIPMMIYGMDVDIEEDVDINRFIQLVDEKSWEEFMPKGVTKALFRKFIKYYDAQVFIEAGRIIRQKVKKLDDLDPIKRTEEIAAIFSTFKNPDKETVLTPWRVVNMQLGMTIGGLSFYDDKYEHSTLDGVSAQHWITTDETKQVFYPQTHILEINSKTGLYPLYAAASLYWQKFNQLNNDQAGKFSTKNQNELWQKILKENIYVVAKTPMAKTITERTLAGYNKINMNIEYIDGIVAAAKESAETGEQKVRDVFGDMKFDVVIGNPPYQEETHGNSSSQKPIFNLFMDLSYKLSNKVVLITPAKFLSNAGGTPKSWNKKMLNDPHFKVVYFEQNSDKIFPKTDIKGGVVISLRDTDEDFGKIGTFTIFEELRSIMKKVSVVSKKPITKIAFSAYSYKLTNSLHQDFPDAINQLSKGHKYDLKSSTIENLPNIFLNKKPNDGEKYVTIIGREKNHRVKKWIKTEYIQDHPNLNKYKVLLPKSNGSGALGEVVSTPLVGTPLVGHTETFMSFGAFDTEEEADALLKYIKTKFARTMLGILKVTQDNPISTWAKVPLQDFTANSDIDWSQSIHDIDQQLYKKYDLNDEEIQFIESHVQEMN